MDGNRLDLDSINLDSSILPHGIVENIEVECDRSLLDDNNIISQVRLFIFLLSLIHKEFKSYFIKLKRNK